MADGVAPDKLIRSMLTGPSEARGDQPNITVWWTRARNPRSF